MHTAKSRNDQVATDVRLVLRDKITETQIGILEFMEGLVEKAGEHLETVFLLVILIFSMHSQLQ